MLWITGSNSHAAFGKMWRLPTVLAPRSCTLRAVNFASGCLSVPDSSFQDLPFIPSDIFHPDAPFRVVSSSLTGRFVVLVIVASACHLTVRGRRHFK